VQLTRRGPIAGACALIAVTLIGNLAACGSILYPDRNGQRAGGPLDPVVVALDGVGLFFFLIPGVIAFAVDFNNHSIYLPHGHRSGLGDAHRYAVVHVDGNLDKIGLQERIRSETGAAIDLRDSRVQVQELGSTAELDAKFAGYERGAGL